MSDYFDAVTDFYDVEHVGSHARIGALGVGRVGWQVTDQAAAHGFRQFRVVDHDKVSPRNVPYGFAEAAIGKPKVDYVTQELAYRWPGLDLGRDRQRVRWQTLREIHYLIEWATFLCIFMDSFRTAHRIVEMTYAHKPMLYAGLLGNGAVGETAFSWPGQTPCLSCQVRLGEKRGARHGRAIPGDIDALANVAVRQLLGLSLIGQRGFEHFRDFVHPRFSLVYVVNRPGGFVEMPPGCGPSGVRLVETVDRQGEGPSLSHLPRIPALGRSVPC